MLFIIYESKNILKYNVRRELIEKVIDFAFSGSVRHGDIPHTLSCLARGSREGRECVWNIIQTKIDFLKEKLGGQFLLSGMLKSVISGFDSEDKIKEIEAFFKEHPVNNAQMAIKQGIIIDHYKTVFSLFFRSRKCSN